MHKRWILVVISVFWLSFSQELASHAGEAEKESAELLFQSGMFSYRGNDNYLTMMVCGYFQSIFVSDYLVSFSHVERQGIIVNHPKVFPIPHDNEKVYIKGGKNQDHDGLKNEKDSEKLKDAKKDAYKALLSEGENGDGSEYNSNHVDKPSERAYFSAGGIMPGLADQILKKADGDSGEPYFSSGAAKIIPGPNKSNKRISDKAWIKDLNSIEHENFDVFNKGKIKSLSFSNDLSKNLLIQSSLKNLSLDRGFYSGVNPNIEKKPLGMHLSQNDVGAVQSEKMATPRLASNLQNVTLQLSDQNLTLANKSGKVGTGKSLAYIPQMTPNMSLQSPIQLNKKTSRELKSLKMNHR